MDLLPVGCPSASARGGVHRKQEAQPTERNATFVDEPVAALDRALAVGVSYKLKTRGAPPATMTFTELEAGAPNGPRRTTRLK